MNRSERRRLVRGKQAGALSAALKRGPLPPEWLCRMAVESRELLMGRGDDLGDRELLYLAGVGVRALEWAGTFLGLERAEGPADVPTADAAAGDGGDPVLDAMRVHDQAMANLSRAVGVGDAAAGGVRRLDGQPLSPDVDGCVSGEPLDLSYLTDEQRAALPRLDPDASDDPAEWVETTAKGTPEGCARSVGPTDCAAVAASKCAGCNHFIPADPPPRVDCDGGVR